MFVTEFGIVTEVRLLHSAKASLPMFVTEFGIVTEVRLLHPVKLFPISLTELGI